MSTAKNTVRFDFDDYAGLDGFDRAELDRLENDGATAEEFAKACADYAVNPRHPQSRHGMTPCGNLIFQDGARAPEWDSHINAAYMLDRAASYMDAE